MALAEKSLQVVLCEGEAGEALTPEQRFATLSALLERGFPTSRRTTQEAATEWMGTTPAGAETPSLCLIFGEVEETRPGARQMPVSTPPETVVEVAITAREELRAASAGGWKPWFPVIDYDRCTNCMQCLSFCLFGVYGVDRERRIQVQNQDKCKTNCPACSRVCPEAAIMFPKYKAGPINGDQVSAADLQREKMKIDISALLGGDIYSMLRTRSERAKSRFSKERDSDKALAERQKCLVKLAAAGDIPPEVLMSLPSPEEIAQRAAEAAARVKAAQS